MRKSSQHIVKHPDGWAVRKSNSSRVTKVFCTQSEAYAHGRDIAINQNAELFVHGRNGQIRMRNSYGNDPISSRG